MATFQEPKQYCIMEDIFPISGFNTPQKQYTKPFDTLSINSVTSVHSDPFDLDDDPERVAAYDAQRLRELVANFARGFDAESFPAYVKGWMAGIHKDLFPGSYAHLMVILLEDWDRMEQFQVSMFKSLCEEHPVPPFYNWGSAHGEDYMMFVSELEILQKLLSPLRGDNSRPVHWIGTRIANSDDSCNQIKTSIRIIKHFKEEISAEIHGPNDDRTIYSPRNSTPDDRKAEASVREFRMDACRASLGWSEFLKTDLHFTSFHQSYKSSLIDTAPERARAIGFLPPLQPAIPKYVPVHPETEPVAWCTWPREDLRNSILDLILKIAVWLGLARGAAAVHLFCDVVHAFTLKMPTQSTPCDRITLLYRFTALRISCEGIESGLATPFAYDDNALSDKNSDYFTDTESSVRSEPDLDISSNCDSAFMDYFKPSTSGSQKLPHIHHRSRISQGQIKTYHDRDVLETLSQASTERTLSSKMVPEKPAVPLQLSLAKLTVTDDNTIEGKPHSSPTSTSQPIQMPNRRRASTIRVGYF